MIDFLSVIDSIKEIGKLFDDKDAEKASGSFPFVDKSRLDEIKENRRTNKKRIDRVLFRLDDIFKDYESEQDPGRKKNLEDEIYENLNLILATYSGRGLPMDKIINLVLSGANPVSIMQAIAYDEFLEKKKKDEDAEEKKARERAYKEAMEKILATIRKNAESYRDMLIEGYTDFYPLLAELNELKAEKRLLELKTKELLAVDNGLQRRYQKHADDHNVRLLELHNKLEAVQIGHHQRLAELDEQRQNLGLLKNRIRRDQERLDFLRAKQPDNMRQLAVLENEHQEARIRRLPQELLRPLEQKVEHKKAENSREIAEMQQLETEIPQHQLAADHETREIEQLSAAEETRHQAETDGVKKEIEAERGHFRKIAERFSGLFGKNKRERLEVAAKCDNLDARIKELQPRVDAAERESRAREGVLRNLASHADAVQDALEIPPEERDNTAREHEAEANRVKLGLEIQEFGRQYKQLQQQISDKEQELKKLEKKIRDYREQGIPEDDFTQELLQQEAAQETLDALKAERVGISSQIDTKKAELQAANNPGNAWAGRLNNVSNALLQGGNEPFIQPNPVAPARATLNNLNTPSQMPQVTPSAPPLPDEASPGNEDNSSEPPGYDDPDEPPPRYHP